MPRMSLPQHPRAVVTGAGSGLGRAFCLELAKDRGRVLAADINLAAAEETVRLVKEAGAEAVAVRCDVAKPAEVEGLAAAVESAFGGVDLVVNNAGVAVGGPVGDVPLDDWAWIMGINLWGVVYGCHTFIPRLRAQGSGHILNVASAAGLLSAPLMGPYNVTKAGVVALSETLAGELAGTGVGVTVLCPTFFQTNIGRSGRVHGGEGASDTAKLEELMARARVQAPGVARAALAAAAAGKLYALPHVDGRWLWRLKRLVPGMFQSAIVPRAVRFTRGRQR
jgi:NAD(P)-dependent dehydrogenase (short-subunit alcohol dehydrogenase family)